ncbi:transposable element tcb2 transposase [Trichonephila clavipes]|nr:transposable element tcb2 transposase [Trichonephila clavipes]
MGRVQLALYRTPDTSRYDPDRWQVQWLQEHSSEFRLSHCPPKFPDMNIIQYICDALQRAVKKRSPPLLTATDLWTVLQDS